MIIKLHPPMYILVPLIMLPITPLLILNFSSLWKNRPKHKNKVFNVKNIALGKRFCCTKPCKSKNCKCCKFISKKDRFTSNNTTVKTAGGSCKSYNIIYLFYCRICKKLYIGRSTRLLRIRLGEHRRNFIHMCNNPDLVYDKESDDFILGHHLYHDHNIKMTLDVDNSNEVAILDISSPKVLDLKEHKFIHLLNSLAPIGLNLNNPLAIPPLYN